MSDKTKTIILGILTGLLTVLLIASAIYTAVERQEAAPLWISISVAVIAVGLLVVDAIETAETIKNINKREAEKKAAEEKAKEEAEAAKLLEIEKQIKAEAKKEVKKHTSKKTTKK